MRQRELGMRLRQLRHNREMTVEAVAAELLCSATKISRIETGARRASLRDVRDLCRIYEVTDEAVASDLMDLARQAREPGWWRQYDDLGVGPYIGLEQAATAISHYGMYFMHGLLQTEDYARAIIKGIYPKMDPKVLDQRVEARMRRRGLLEQENRPRFRELLDEAALRRQIGGPAVMYAQLDSVIQLIREEKVTVQVIPFDAGRACEPGKQLHLPGVWRFFYSEPDLVEGLVSNLYQERISQLERYREALESLSDAALSPRDSVNFIAEIRSACTE